MSEQSTTSEERYARLVEIFLGKPDVTQEGKGFGSTALKVNGKIFAMLAGGKLVVKLPRSRVDALIAAGAGERFDPRHDGRLMKEWLTLETASEAEWLALANEALEFVASKR